MSSRRSALPTVLVIAFALASGAVIWPELFGLHRAPFFSQLVSFRGVLAITAVVIAMAFLAVLAARRSWAIAAATVVAVGAASISVALIANRGFEPAAVADGDLVVLSWNTEMGAPGATSVARAVLDADADVAVLPETSSVLAAEVVRILERDGKTMVADSAFSGSEQFETSILIDASLGAYERDESAGSTPALPSGVWRPVDGSGPVLVAAHPIPPLPGAMDAWRGGLEWLADQCRGSNVVLAGDLNSTVDHWGGLASRGAHLGDCSDTAIELDAAARATWPSSLPDLVGTPIDHVLATSQWEPVSFDVVTELDDSGSDHRPIVAVLRYHSSG